MLLVIILLVALEQCSSFPHCHWVINEDVWKQRSFFCTVPAPLLLDDEPYRYKLSFYAESKSKIFKDKLRYKIIGGNGIDILNSTNTWISNTPTVDEWFTCKRVMIIINPENPYSLPIEGANCPIIAFIQNKNFLTKAKLIITFHIDDQDVQYQFPHNKYNISEDLNLRQLINWKIMQLSIEMNIRINYYQQGQIYTMIDSEYV
ncbi:MAG: hypothetical protein EZS28_004149 [Streblomastix strix]|uniref:Uncharacterized protein n=1 Tax=Streblomastix strix TaxID=222440 RepID=A0A5J4WYX3_9EUKA|nr:MAG: hypothetical protein EZS28_004149 [Streblomastix strix]